MPSRINFKPEKVIDCIIDGAKEKAILLGVLNAKFGPEIYKEQIVGKYKLSLLKIELPNRKSRLDVLYLNNLPVGTIVSSEIILNFYHMIGMYVVEQYRSSKINDTLPGFAAAKKSINMTFNPAEFLLKGYLQDVLSQHNKQISLEVLDGNIPAWKFYEKRLYQEKGSKQPKGFELMTKKEIMLYARQRGKKIKRWVEVLTQSGREGYAVHWDHIPEYGPGTEMWAVNRIYIIKSCTQNILLEQEKKARFFVAIATGYTIIRYGDLLGYLRFKLQAFKK